MSKMNPAIKIAAIGAAKPQREEDRQLITRFLEGEESAFSTLMTKYRRAVYSIAYRFTGNHEEANDLTQDVFLKAYEKLATFRGEASFKTWLFRITTNLSINVKKSGRFSKDGGVAPEEDKFAVFAQGPGGLIESERHRELYQAIAKLPPRQKQSLMLKTFSHMTCEEVAGVMNCSVGTVKANVFNALKRLKTLLNPGGAL